jgi:hypothetical protein
MIWLLFHTNLSLLCCPCFASNENFVSVGFFSSKYAGCHSQCVMHLHVYAHAPARLCSCACTSMHMHMFCVKLHMPTRVYICTDVRVCIYAATAVAYTMCVVSHKGDCPYPYPLTARAVLGLATSVFWFFIRHEPYGFVLQDFLSICLCVHIVSMVR